MKIMTSFTIALASLVAFAGNGIERLPTIDFTNAQEMSYRAQVKLEKTILSQCAVSASSATSLSAKLIGLTNDRVDNGIIDVTYVVEVKFHGWDQYESETAVVKLTDYAGYNPSIDWVTVHEISSSTQGLCK